MIPNTVDAVVQMCGDAAFKAAEVYRVGKLKLKPQSRLRTLADGSKTIRVWVSITYDDRLQPETRQGTVLCHVLPDGEVKLENPE